MSYDGVAAKIQGILQLLTTVFPTSSLVTIADYRVLDSGITNAAVLVPGNFDGGEAHGYETTVRWDVLVDLFTKYTTNQAATITAFTAMRDAVIAKLNLYPSLLNESGVSKIVVTGDGDPTDVMTQEVPVFIFQRLRVTVTQRVALTGGEYV